MFSNLNSRIKINIDILHVYLKLEFYRFSTCETHVISFRSQCGPFFLQRQNPSANSGAFLYFFIYFIREKSEKSCGRNGEIRGSLIHEKTFFIIRVSACTPSFSLLFSLIHVCTYVGHNIEYMFFLQRGVKFVKKILHTHNMFECLSFDI